MPPLSEVLNAIFQKFLPAAGTAAMVYATVVLLFGSRPRMIGAWLAMALAWGVVNMNFNYPLRLLEWQPWAEGGKPIDWLPWVAMAAMTVGVFSDAALPWFLRLILFAGLAGASAWLLVPESVDSSTGVVVREKDWPMLLAAAAVAGLNSCVTWYLARRHPGGVVPLIQSVSLLGCSMVLIYANSAKLMDVSVGLGSAMFGIALMAWLTKSDAGIVSSALGVLLPGLMLIGWQGTGSDIPKDAVIAAGTAPVAMGLTLLIPAARLSGRVGWIVPLGTLALPVGWALARSMQFGSLAV
jgi:hypothetical protein